MPLESFENHCDAAMSDEKEGSELLAQRKHLNKDKLEDMDVSLEKLAAMSGHTLQTYNYNMAHSFYELFQDMKIWDICGHLQLVSSIFIKLSSNESILKKSFQKFVFGAGQKNVIF